MDNHNDYKYIISNNGQVKTVAVDWLIRSN